MGQNLGKNKVRVAVMLASKWAHALSSGACGSQRSDPCWNSSRAFFGFPLCASITPHAWSPIGWYYKLRPPSDACGNNCNEAFSNNVSEGNASMRTPGYCG